MTSDDPELRAWMQRVEGYLEAMTRVLSSGRPTGTLTATQRQVLEALLPALVAQWAPGVIFTVREALEHVADRPELMAAVLRGEQVDGSSVARRLGKLLAAAANSGQPVSGLVVGRGSKGAQGVHWTLRRV